MFHMLSCFNLNPGVEIDEYSRSLLSFSKLMIKNDMLHSIGKIGKRVRHPIMDTDEERNQQYYFTMTFKDRNQCDRGVDYIHAHLQPGDDEHRAMYEMVTDPIFICFEDVNRMPDG